MAVGPAVVLIHGEGFGSWIWTEVAGQLENPSLAPSFPQRGNSQNDTALDDYFQHLVRQIDQSGFEHFVLVCHAAGCIPGLMLAKHYGSRVLGFIAIAGIIPAEGKSYHKALPWRRRFVHDAVGEMDNLRRNSKLAQTVEGRKNLESLKPDFTVTREADRFYKDACHAPIPKVRSLYIKCENDPVLPYNLQRQMRLNLNPLRVIKLPFGHVPMLDHSRRLATLLQHFIDEVC